MSARQQVIDTLDKGDFFHILFRYHDFLEDEEGLAGFNNDMERAYGKNVPVLILTPSMLEASVARVFEKQKRSLLDELHKARVSRSEGVRAVWPTAFLTISVFLPRHVFRPIPFSRSGRNRHQIQRPVTVAIPA